MAVLDRYVEEMSKHSADALIFAPNKLVEMHVRGEVRTITAQPASAEQLARLVQDVVGADYATRLASGLGVFTHQTPAGAVSVTVVRNHLGMTITVEPTGALIARAPTPPSVPSRSPTSVPAPAPAGLRSMPPGQPGRSTGPQARVDPGGRLPRNIEELFTHMVEMNASDLHLQTGKAPVARVDGNLIRMNGWGRLQADLLTELIRAIAPERNFKEFEKYGDTDWAYETDGARIRCNIFRDRLGLSACFRQIPWKIRTAKELNLPPAVIDFCDLHKGFVVVAGPTGSGKSTTLAAMIDHINETQDTHIITVEDPIEFVHPEKRSHVNQREVGPQTRSFKTALRAALREDPDIVLVGEMRDLETVAIAIETAETGHLVFGTLHTNTAASTIDRIINQFPADRQPQIRAMLADSLRGVVSQTLVKRKGGGRVAAMEILLVTHAVSNLIREGKTHHIGGIMQTSRNIGMQTQSDALFDLVKSGLVDPKEAYEHAVDKKELGFLLTKAGIKGNWETA